eukprot:SAG31_NODE_33907_length_338_cov_28.418410_1_plen_38_part_10
MVSLDFDNDQDATTCKDDLVHARLQSMSVICCVVSVIL